MKKNHMVWAALVVIVILIIVLSGQKGGSMSDGVSKSKQVGIIEHLETKLNLPDGEPTILKVDKQDEINRDDTFLDGAEDDFLIIRYTEGPSVLEILVDPETNEPVRSRSYIPPGAQKPVVEQSQENELETENDKSLEGVVENEETTKDVGEEDAGSVSDGTSDEVTSEAGEGDLG